MNIRCEATAAEHSACFNVLVVVKEHSKQYNTVIGIGQACHNQVDFSAHCDFCTFNITKDKVMEESLKSSSPWPFIPQLAAVLVT